jgi:N6-adenosine-specific RNA methylase IME4
MSEFRTIVADPPWTPSLGGTWGAKVDKGRPQRFYETQTLDWISGLKVPAAKQAHLYLWAITPHVDWAFDVARAWDFEPVTMLTWRKPGLGVGRFRCNTEHVVIARKGPRQGNAFGSGGRNSQATAGTCFEWKRGAHSEKPDEFFDLVEQLSPGPYLELFARRARLGWERWGDEVDSSIALPDEGER